MKNIKLIENCAYGLANDEVLLDDHTADFLIRTQRGYEVRGTEQGVVGFAVENIGITQEYINEVDTETGDGDNLTGSKKPGSGRNKEKIK